MWRIPSAPNSEAMRPVVCIPMMRTSNITRIVHFQIPVSLYTQAQVISPTACGALFSARTTPQPGRTSWNLVEPSWNPDGTLPQGCPGPPRSLSGLRPQSFQLLGKYSNQKRTYNSISMYTYIYRGLFAFFEGTCLWFSGNLKEDPKNGSPEKGHVPIQQAPSSLGPFRPKQGAHSAAQMIWWSFSVRTLEQS